MAETRKTFCRHCMSICGLNLEVENNKVIRVRGDKEHPVSQGYSCAMGQHNMAVQDDPMRLMSAQQRREDGSYDAIAVDDALDRVSEKLRQLLDQHGPRSIALYHGTGTAYSGLAYNTAKSWLRSIGSPELYTSMTVDQSSMYICRDRMGAFKTGRPYLDQLDVIMLIGNNVAISHQGYRRSPVPGTNPRKSLIDARARGTKVIVVDPRRTETVRYADEFLQIKPGTDCALLATMIRVILKEGWYDHDFCDRFVTSMDKLEEAVEPFSLEYGSQQTGIEADQIYSTVKLFATARRANAGLGTGPCFGPHSNLAEHLVEVLNALLGSYRRAGDRVRTGLSNMKEVVEGVSPPNRTWETGVKLRTADIGHLNSEFPSSRLPFEILHEGEDRVRALIVCGGNPLTSIGGTERTYEAFESLELLVSIDPRWSPTGRLAHYVIPTKLPIEREDMNIALDGQRRIQWVDYTQPVIQPPENTLEDWEVFWEFSRRMGVQLNFRPGSWGVQRGEGIDLDMQTRPTTADMYRYLCEVAGIDYDTLRHHPSGMMLDKEPLIVQPAREDDGVRLDLCPDDVREEIKAVFSGPESSDPDYPYLMVSRRVQRVMNAMYHNLELVQDKFEMAPFFMHPSDIEKEKLQPGDVVSIRSRAGKIVGRLTADETLQRGVVAMPMGWGSADPSDAQSTLTSQLVSIDADVEAINFMPRQTAIPVAVSG